MRGTDVVHVAALIKPLVWRQGFSTVQSATPFPGFTYAIGQHERTWHWWRAGRMHFVSPPCADVVAAKAGAQADFYRRMSAHLIGVSIAARDVLIERQRQIAGEGWTTEHDDEQPPGDLAQAGATYALHATGRFGTRALTWPWQARWWKPTDRRRDLVKAAALILAEIERLDRASEPPAVQRIE